MDNSDGINRGRFYLKKPKLSVHIADQRLPTVRGDGLVVIHCRSAPATAKSISHGFKSAILFAPLEPKDRAAICARRYAKKCPELRSPYRRSGHSGKRFAAAQKRPRYASKRSRFREGARLTERFG